jgi:1-acyl-sn-glycerol-3-phosphate acyltransferase
VDRARFQTVREARPAAADDATALRFVACGRPLEQHEIRIVDESGHARPERIEGRIEFRGPSVTTGYFRRPDATRAVVHDGWMDSGDLGYVADGELFITGRQKDMIIKAGRNLYPQEVEDVVGDVPGIRKGCVAAFGTPDPERGTERLVVVAETRAQPAARRDLEAVVVDRVVTTLGVPPDVVVLARPRSVRKTSSGKIRRGATRDAYLSGALERMRSPLGQWAYVAMADLLARLRRVRAGTVHFAYGAWVGVLLAIGLPVLWAVLHVTRKARTADRLVRLYCRTLLALAGCRLHVAGVEHLQGARPVVLAVNHSSYADAVVLLAALPPTVPFVFVAKRELLRSPLVGTVIRRLGYPTVERFTMKESVADAGTVSDVLRAGSSLLVFPEGTFRRTPGLLAFRLGGFKAAVESRRPVVPVAIRGTREILPADAWLPRRHDVYVTIGSPIAPAGEGWPEMVRLRDVTRAAIDAATAAAQGPAAVRNVIVTDPSGS